MIIKGGIVNITFNGDGGVGEDDTAEGMEEDSSMVVDDLVFVDTDSSGGDGARGWKFLPTGLKM